MQCPNCGKEAINVNGKFVCLDCGVELNPAAENAVTPANQPAITPEPSISKYSGSAPVSVPEPIVTPPITPAPTAAPAPEPNIPTPVKDAYENDLAKESEGGQGSYDFAAPEPPTASPVPAEASEPVVPTPTPAPEIPETYFQPEAVDITPKTAEPSAPAGTIDAFSAPTIAKPNEPLVGQLEGQEPVPETPATPPVTEATELFTDEPVVEPTPVTAPNNANLDDLLNSYSNPQAGANLGASTPAPMTNPAFDSLRAPSNYTSEQPPANPYQPSYPDQTQVANPSTPMPGTSTIPSAESVFGSGDNGTPEKLNVVAPGGGNKKKIIIIVVCALVGILVLGGLVWLGISLVGRSKTPNSSSEQKIQETTLRISEEISSVMDSPQNVLAQYDQSIDFKGVTFDTPETATETPATGNEVLALLFENPLTAKGTWQTDERGNVALDGTVNNVASKIIYLEEEKSSYVFSNDAGSWAKVDGDQIANIPPFYPPAPKGVVFYNTKVNSIAELGKEDIDGGSYRKMKIVPKVDLFEEAIRGTSPALSTLKFTSVNTDKVEVFAWVTDDGKIYKISLVGDLEVETNLFSGTVKLNSTVKYLYQTVTIQKPELPAV